MTLTDPTKIYFIIGPYNLNENGFNIISETY